MMSCARGRIRNDSGKIIERDGLLSKRHLDQQTSKFRSKDHQGLAPVLRNSEPRIKELVRGGASSDRRKVYGDPSKLDCFNLIDLHPASWYSVAWYPIYRIPEGKFRAAFLTYHSLGHFPRTTSKRPGGLTHIVSPVVGLQSYNAKGECWFQPSIRTIKMAQTEEALSSDPSEVVKERLRTLEQTAYAMARASVCKNNQSSANRQPDYEFFMSRR